MYALLVIIHVLVSIVLCVVVLLQSSKGGGLAGAFGGGGGAPQQILGSRGMTTLLHKVTIYAGIGFMVTSLSLFVLSGSRAGASAGGTINERVRRGEMTKDVTEPPAANPVTPTTPPAPTPAPGGGK
jgi:preprotein translocase subunit SecG